MSATGLAVSSGAGTHGAEATSAAAPPDLALPRARRVASTRVTFPRVVSSEWIKLRSVRSAVLSLLAAAATVVVLGLLLSGVKSGGLNAQEIGLQAGTDPVSTSLGGVNLSQLMTGVLGVILVTGEYSTGTIRSTLVAVPRRLPVLWAKAVVFGGAAIVCMLAATLAAFLGGQAVVGHAGASLGDPGALRAVTGAAVYLTGVGLLGLAAGVMLRGTAAAIGTLFGMMYAIPALFPLLPHAWNDAVGPYLPSNAGMAVMSVSHAAGMLSPMTGLAVFAGYILATFAAAAVLLKRRDG